ncbi:7064_t:CDS:2, partial [Gigaspora rosea]
KDVLSQWTYPIAPDSNLQEGNSYEFMCRHIYKEKDVSLSRQDPVHLLIGAVLKLLKNVKITILLFGQRVTIGTMVLIFGITNIPSNNVVLEENALSKEDAYFLM